MRVLIADDAAPVRSAIRRLLKEEADMQVVGEATTLGELMRKVRALKPELILLDWELSGLPGSAKLHPTTPNPLTRAEKRRNVILAGLCQFPPYPRLLVLSSYPEARRWSEDAGADAFVLKGDPPEKLREAVRLLKEVT